MPIKYKKFRDFNSKNFYIIDCWDMLKRYASISKKPITMKQYYRLYHMEYEKLVYFHWNLMKLLVRRG